jgi:pimeloyl-ACP methyl ester carboxylesterase
MARFVRDAHHYFFNVEFSPRPGATFRVRDELRRRFVQCLREGVTARPLIVVSHSMGTIIAYDCLQHEPDCPAVDGLITIGSPLGLDEVQDFFPGRSRSDAFPSAKLKGPWVNVFDPLDVVAGADPYLADDYQRAGQRVVEDIAEANWGTWRHSISKYLQGPQLRSRLAGMLAVEWT